VLAWLPARLQDVRVALRMFRHRPGFVGVAVLSLGIGIGLATSIFTVANAVLLRKLAVHDQNRIVVLWGESPDGRFSNWPVSPIAARSFAERSHALTDVAVFGFWGSSPVAVAQADRVVPLRQSVVSGNFFSVLGTTAAIGRTLLASDDVAGAAPVAVLSYGAWTRQFGADPAVLGRRLKLAAGPSYTVVGVMPAGIDYPHGSEFWVPITSLGADVDSLGEVDMVGRLAPGATAAMSAQELSDFLRTAPSQNLRALRGVATTLPELIIGPIRPAVIAFGAAVLLLLVITCTNVTNLLLVRGVNRVGEMAVRTALGASRRRLVAQLLTENALLAIGGGIAGVVIAWACTRGFVALAPAGLPRIGEVRLDAAAFAGAAAITVGTMLAAGLLPAIATARATSKQVLRSAGRAGTGRGSRGMSEALVAGQLALALVVLSSATVVLESLRGLETTNLAFNGHSLSVVDLTLRQGAYDSVTDQVRMLTRLAPAIEAVPGVQAASPVVADPFAEAAWAGRLFTAAQSTTERAKNPVLDLELVAPSYFRALGITIVHGRVSRRPIARGRSLS
jgi:predicted permease